MQPEKKKMTETGASVCLLSATLAVIT